MANADLSARRCTSWTTSSASPWWRRAPRATTGSPAQLIRYQFGNHLGSASLELDDQAQIISYEEYYPYGSTSYQAVRSQTEAPKRYRYTGKERDEETGLVLPRGEVLRAVVGKMDFARP